MNEKYIRFDWAAKAITEHIMVQNDVMDTAHAEGIIQGKLEIAANMKGMGMTAEQIMQATGLTEKEISEYRWKTR